MIESSFEVKARIARRDWRRSGDENIFVKALEDVSGKEMLPESVNGVRDDFLMFQEWLEMAKHHTFDKFADALRERNRTEAVDVRWFVRLEDKQDFGCLPLRVLLSPSASQNAVVAAPSPTTTSNTDKATASNQPAP